MIPHTITIHTMGPGHIGYKATSFEHWNPSKYNPLDDDFWSGFYLAEKEEIAAVYLPDMVDTGFAFIQEVLLDKPIKVITYLDEAFAGGTEGIDKAELMENLRDVGIDLDITKPLMSQLGDLGYVFRCFHDMDHDMEIIIPNKIACDTESGLDMLCYKKVKMKHYEIVSEEVTEEWKQSIDERIRFAKSALEDSTQN